MGGNREIKGTTQRIESIAPMSHKLPEQIPQEHSEAAFNSKMYPLLNKAKQQSAHSTETTTKNKLRISILGHVEWHMYSEWPLVPVRWSQRQRDL